MTAYGLGAAGLLSRSMIPVVDIFAGPGGLGEGFSAWGAPRTSNRFQLAVSIEKDELAHATLRLRAFRRCFSGEPPRAYWRLLRGEASWGDLQVSHPREATRAEREARQITLGADTALEVRSIVEDALNGADRWVLIGGPPCQAYSLAGRSRSRGIADYRAELDHRQTLYVEYLQILADHAPPVFVMENVKGLLSARVNKLGMFERIREDLRHPAKALKREGRQTGNRHPKYRIRALVPPLDPFGDAPTNYLVKSEEFGIPQRRHRVILLGIREDFTSQEPRTMSRASHEVNVRTALAGLPRLRSGLSKHADSDDAWLRYLRAIEQKSWFKRLSDERLKNHIQETLNGLTIPRASRGSNYLEKAGEAILNHSSRSHMDSDLDRYLFASAFAALRTKSPVLADFPHAILPEHENVREAMGGGLFADRFRVQLSNSPSTTITSHISKDGHYYIHPDPSQCRSLTPREAARLQTFPDDYFFCGPRTAQYHQVGNAVPPELARQIAGIVADLLDC